MGMMPGCHPRKDFLSIYLLSVGDVVALNIYQLCRIDNRAVMYLLITGAYQSVIRVYLFDLLRDLMAKVTIV
ncbi:MAG: hypothetical protein KJ950_15950 [Proteobacteria bacterium]|nr:hypothetical protein [Pseudomonadota bacterium]MBU1688840.1 hypothetical protein [Pseudomonadota bacterium]